MLQNAYFLAKIGADTAENEQHFAEILPTDALGRAGRAPIQAPRALTAGGATGAARRRASGRLAEKNPRSSLGVQNSSSACRCSSGGKFQDPFLPFLLSRRLLQTPLQQRRRGKMGNSYVRFPIFRLAAHAPLDDLGDLYAESGQT